MAFVREKELNTQMMVSLLTRLLLNTKRAAKTPRTAHFRPLFLSSLHHRFLGCTQTFALEAFFGTATPPRLFPSQQLPCASTTPMQGSRLLKLVPSCTHFKFPLLCGHKATRLSQRSNLEIRDSSSMTTSFILVSSWTSAMIPFCVGTTTSPNKGGCHGDIPPARLGMITMRISNGKQQRFVLMGTLIDVKAMNQSPCGSVH